MIKHGHDQIIYTYFVLDFKENFELKLKSKLLVDSDDNIHPNSPKTTSNASRSPNTTKIINSIEKEDNNDDDNWIKIL